MDNLNLQLQQNWLNNKRVLSYTLYSLNNSTMQDWSENIFNTLSDWPGTGTPCILFDLSNTNVSMSYFVLTGRDLFNFATTDKARDMLNDLVEAKPELKVKLAVLLSQTMAGVITDNQGSSTDLKQLVTGKVFFERDRAIRWLNTDESDTSDTRTRAINVDDLLSDTDLGGLGREMFRAGINQLRLLVNGSLEIVPISESSPVVIGRNPDADLDVSSHGRPSLTVSRNHAQISFTNGEYTVLDLNSTNGTTVGNKRLESGKPHTLRREEEIHIGALSIRVLF